MYTKDSPRIKKDPNIMSVRVFENGVVVVFDYHGQQMPQYQDPMFHNNFQKLIKYLPEDADVNFNCVWK